MSEIGDDFKFLKEIHKNKRESNQLNSTQILINKGVSFESKNNGNHLIIAHGAKAVDFWPSTGKFISRVSNKNSRGVFNLLKYIGAL